MATRRLREHTNPVKPGTTAQAGSARAIHLRYSPDPRLVTVIEDLLRIARLSCQGDALTMAETYLGSRLSRLADDAPERSTIEGLRVYLRHLLGG